MSSAREVVNNSLFFIICPSYPVLLARGRVHYIFFQREIGAILLFLVLVTDIEIFFVLC